MEDKDDYIDIVFDNGPGPTGGSFVETEKSDRSSVRLGTWIRRDDGFWALRVTKSDFQKVLP